MVAKRVSWEARLGFPLDNDLASCIEECSPAPDDPLVVVCLCSGVADRVRPVTSVSATAVSLVLHYGKAAIASYPLHDVFYLGGVSMPPVPS